MRVIAGRAFSGDKAELSGAQHPLKAELNSEIYDFIYSYETYACGINETYACGISIRHQIPNDKSILRRFTPKDE